jgi:hypothetical protein
MPNLYRITPLEKKNIEFFIDVFERTPDGEIRGFDATFVYRWGQGFREIDEEVWKWEVGSNGVHCRPDIGCGCELDDLCGVYVNFSDGFTDDEKSQIEALCKGEQEDDEGRWGEGWIYDGDHNWEIEDDHIRITGPVKIDIVDQEQYNCVIEENIEPYDNESQ